jgi:predicted PurR-regulated permease PerM
MARSRAKTGGSPAQPATAHAADGPHGAAAPAPAATANPGGSSALVHAVIVALAGAAGLFLAWTAAHTLFMIFAGLLFAALLDACACGLAKLLPVRRAWHLAIVNLGFMFAIAGLMVWSGISIAVQINTLVSALNERLHAIEQGMVMFGFTPADPDKASISDIVRFLFPNLHQLFGEAQGAFNQALGGAGDAVLIVLIGIFVAADPASHKRAMLELLPQRQRHRASIILDESALFLQRWLIGQLAAMLLLAVLIWIALAALHVPSALLLGTLAGLLEFIPYFGAAVAALPILLMALPLGTSTLLITLVLYLVIHLVVGNIVMPMIQKRTVDLPPAIALASLTVFGVLFGVASIAVATPAVAAIRHAILRLPQLPAEDAAVQAG